MMTHLRVASVFTLSLAALIGCGDEATGNDGGVTADTGVAADSGVTADSGVAAVSCDDYCTKVMANCTGNLAQYSSLDACKKSCAAFPVGTAADTSGNTQGCRQYHAGAAMAAPTVHCVHAGPSGGGACGTPCEGFCSIQDAACTGALAAGYGTGAACNTACTAAFATNIGTYSATVTGGNSLACRLYHLTVAASSAANATIHCPHTSAVSATCN